MSGGLPIDMSIYDRIRANHFEVDMHYPSRKSYNKGGEGEANYRKAISEYRRLQGEKLDEFKKAALYSVGLENHPNKDKIYYYAWEDGHSSGLHEVYMVLCNLSELFFHNGKMLMYTEKDLKEAKNAIPEEGR